MSLINQHPKAKFQEYKIPAELYHGLNSMPVWAKAEIRVESRKNRTCKEETWSEKVVRWAKKWNKLGIFMYFNINMKLFGITF